MAKLAPETNVMAVGEKKYMDFEFDADLDGTTLVGQPTITVSAGGPSVSERITSGTRAQGYYDATSALPGLYTVDCYAEDNSTPPQYVHGRGFLLVGNLG